MAWQPCCELRKNSCFHVLFVILLFYVLDVVCITVYDRHAFKQWFLHHATQTVLRILEGRCFVYRHRIRALCLGRTVAKRRKRADVLVRLRRRPLRSPLPTILLANVQSVICLTETWMSVMVPDSAIKLTGFSVYRSDRTKELIGKSRGGGVWFFINNLWCDERNLYSI